MSRVFCWKYRIIHPAPSPFERMARRPQSTRLERSVIQFLAGLDDWAENPWRRLSLLAIALLTGFVIGSAVTSVSGVLGEMDPVAALVVVVVTELTVRWRSRPWPAIADQLVSMIRIGFLYGLFLEAFKLI